MRLIMKGFIMIVISECSKYFLFKLLLGYYIIYIHATC